MKLLTPHYFILALTAIAAGLVGVGTAPAFVQYAPTLNSLAGVCTGLIAMLGVVSHSATGTRGGVPGSDGAKS